MMLMFFDEQKDVETHDLIESLQITLILLLIILMSFFLCFFIVNKLKKLPRIKVSSIIKGLFYI